GDVRIPVDLQRFQLTGRRRSDPLLRDGDVIHIPVSTTHIGIEGAVGRPGQFEIAADDSLSTLLGLGGGPLPESIDDALLVRFRDASHLDTLSFRVSDVIQGRSDVPLRDGDRAFVYFQPRYHQLRNATILGEVRRPGAIPLEEGRTRLTDLVAAAGG